MEFSKIFEQLCREKKDNPTSIGAQLGFSKATVSKWRNSKSLPNNKSLQRLALFFDVSTDYLLGKTKIRNSNKEFTEKEKVMLCVFGTTQVSPKAWDDYEKSIEIIKKKHHIKQPD